MVSRYFPIEEYEGRWERVHAEMKRRGLDVAVVWGRSAGGYERCADVLYLTNYFSTNSGQASDPGFPRWIASLMTFLGDSAIRINAIPSSRQVKPVSPCG